jgi:hypothetical protein
LLGLLKENLLRRYVKHFIYPMTSQRVYGYQEINVFNIYFAHGFSCRFGFLQEEKLEPLRNITDDPRIRLLNRLYARKRKELKEREKLKVPTFTYSLVFCPHYI